MKPVFAGVILLFLSFSFVPAQSPDEQYVRIYQIIQEADRLNDSGQTPAAAAKYVEAQEGLTRFRGIYPGWNERVINYRLNYVRTKLAPLASMLAAPGVTPGTNVTPATSVTSSMTNVAVTATTNPAVTVPANPVAPIASDFESQFKALQAEVTRLQADNRLLGAKLKEALSVQPAAVDPRELAKAEERIRTLQKENELYKAQLSHKASSPSAPAVPQDITARVNEQNELVTTLRAENEILKKHNAEWRQKYDTLFAAANASRSESTGLASAARDESARDLAAKNLALQKQVELWKQVAQNSQRSQPATAITGMPLEARRELEALRARLQVLEAKPVPYTAEELALFEKPPASLAANVATSSGSSGTVLPAEGPLIKVSRGIPPGAGALVRAAERAFAMANYVEAEQKYLDVLRQDENNVTMLGNVASAQLERGQIEAAEKNVNRALKAEPNDYFALYLLGRIRFRQEKLDEAFVALSRSAQANPDYADTQNYLGIVLSEKGQRGPAEAALRRAVQLQPENAVAHNNLALVYATQKPPALALARWHYRKAMAAGHPKNAELEKLIGQSR